MQNENTNQILKSVVSAMNIHLSDSHISTSHRLNQPSKWQQGKPQQHPPIIVRLSYRDKRNEIFRKRELLENNPTIKSIFGNSHVNITENLTKHRKLLLDSTKLAKKKTQFQVLVAISGSYSN